MTQLDLIASTRLETARTDPHGRSSEIVVHDGPLRQTVLALVAGTELGEHNSPPAASMQVLIGRVRITSPGGDTELAAGDLRVLTHERHGVTAVDDSVFLLTTVTGVPTSDDA